MQELLEYRRRLLDRFAAQPADLLQAVCDLDRGRRAAPGIGEWSPHQVLSHLRDAESRVFLPACRRIVEEDQPKLEAFDGQEWMARNYDADESHDELCKAFTLARQKAVTVVGGLPALAWKRTAIHPTLGTRTLQWWVERGVTHTEEHLAQLRKT